MYNPIYLKISPNRVIDVNIYDIIKWGKHDNQYLAVCRNRESKTYERIEFSCKDYIFKFASYFDKSDPVEILNSIEKEINN